MKISILKCFPPCGGGAGLAEMEIKQELYSKLHLPEHGFEAQQKKIRRITGPHACTGTLWDYVILPPVHTMDSLFYALKGGSKHK